jgi:ribosomal protein L9
MANHEILLLKPVEGLGGEGDQVKVRAGYARNFLLPRASRCRSRGQPQARRGPQEAPRLREAKELDGAQALAKKIEKTSLAFAVKTGEGGKLFGAITSADIHDQAGRGRRHRSTEAHPPAHAGQDPRQARGEDQAAPEVTRRAHLRCRLGKPDRTRRFLTRLTPERSCGDTIAAFFCPDDIPFPVPVAHRRFRGSCQ